MLTRLAKIVTDAPDRLLALPAQQRQLGDVVIDGLARRYPEGFAGGQGQSLLRKPSMICATAKHPAEPGQVRQARLDRA